MSLREQILKKNWSDTEIIKYLGEVRNAYMSYALDENIRSEAASGGTTTAILIAALQQNIIDGAIVCKSVIEDGKVRGKVFIATTKEAILAARGSKYVAVDFIKAAKQLIKNFDGKLAVVGLPCNITVLKKLEQRGAIEQNKIVFTIALFCGHTSGQKLIDIIVAKLEKEASSRITEFKFSIGLWRGQLRTTFANGTVIEKPSSFFKTYQNLFFYSEKKCFYCCDHFGYNADISIGDVWSFSHQKNDIKNSGILTRTEIGDHVVSHSHEEYCLLKKCPAVSILDGQKRTAPAHYNVSARHKAAKFWDMNIPDRVNEKVSFRELAIAWFYLANWHWSRSKTFSKYIFIVPRPLFKIYLIIIKGLESFK